VTCLVPGYSDCGPAEFRRGEGTSFAAPQVSAAAALIMAERPFIRPDQVITILERAAIDATPARGCRRCWSGRDDFTGWGVLDIASAVESLAGPLPDADTREPNDEAARRAWSLVWGGPKGRRIAATINYWQDPVDVYRVWLRRGQRIRATLHGPRTADVRLLLWKPGTKRVEGLAVDRRRLAARSARGGLVKGIRYRAARTGTHYLQVKASEGFGRYILRFLKRPARVTGSRATLRQGRRGSAAPGSPQREFAGLRP
jgi:hypothetical protein